MDIKKYFTKTNTQKKPADLKRKKGDLSEDDDDFQPKLKSKHFTSNDEEVADPKDFFSSSSKKTSNKKTEPKDVTVEIKKPEAAHKTTTESKKATTKKPTETKKSVAKTKETKKEAEPKETKKSTSKPITRKKVGDKRDLYVDEDDEDDESAPTKKRHKKATSPAPIKEPVAKEAAAKEPAAKEPTNKKRRTLPTKKAEDAPVKKEEEEEEAKPKAASKKNYFAMMKNIEAPKALGTRPEPVGAPNCFDGLTFVISGQYETLTKEQTKDIIMRYGGRVTGAVSGKTNYLLRGRDAGESKLAKAKSVGTKILNEDEFYELVETTAEKKSSVVPPPTPKAAATKTTKGKAKAAETSATTDHADPNSLLWTDKYKPTELKEIIGNKELVNNISKWLAQWQDSLAQGFEGSDIHSFRALLLSGPPGIGKTTTANVVARVNGYEALEFNASDVRSKRILEESISEMMDNRTMTEYFQPSKQQAKDRLIKGKKVVLIMDEVDGMSEGDRGGCAELARMIKESKIPVICICNDSRSQKIAPLLRVCYETKFRRSTAAQIRSRILTIAYKEKLNISPNAIDELVAATQNDIRQIINILSAYRINETSLTYDQAKTLGKTNQKNSTLGLFDIPGELLTGGSWRSKTLTEKYEVYFHDYSLSNLIIQENYLKCSPELARSESGNPKETACNEMDLFAKASEAIADGDLVDSMIHGTTQHWSLMPTHSIFSCVRPASYIRGSVQSRYNFPGWLGQNSKADKFSRLLADAQARMRIKASGDKTEIRQNYIPTLNDRIIKELEQGNYDDAMEIMDTYYLDRECLDLFNDLTFAPAGKGPLAQLPTKVKSTLTRKYNNSKHPVLFQSIKPEKEEKQS